MACTPLKALDDHARMHMHGFSFLKKEDIIFEIGVLKRIFRGADYIPMAQNIMKKCNVLNSAPRLKKMWVFLNYLLYF